ncbi:piggyBac transposable element-derived protein 4-like [Ptychodera flava]|uniref:piggyBac transposable element-derived protein 4-like n=1 Tax=Ptychodera flava TaxID=63121 RepID=UPI00396A4255
MATRMNMDEVDLQSYANILGRVNPEDRDFFARYFLDSDSDDEGEFYGFEDVNFIPIDRIENPDGDIDFADDVANGWSSNPADDSEQLTLPFDYATTGINEDIPADATPLSFVRFFLTDEVLDVTVTETNKYADQVIQEKLRDGGLQQHSRLRRWRPVNKDEMCVFLGVSIAMGILRKPDLDQYWSTNEILYTPFFPKCMSRNRYELILQCLHFNDNQSIITDREAPNFDPLYKIRPVYDIITQRFREVYTPTKCLSLDEAMIPWRG